VLRPRLEGGGKRVLKGVLGEVKVAQQSNQRCQDGARFGPEYPIDSIRGLVHLHLRDIHQGPNLDRTGSSVRNLRSPGDRLVQVLDVDDINAAELLFRIREWAVTRNGFAVAHANRRRRGGGVERFAGEHLARFLELDRVGHVVVKDAALLLLGLFRKVPFRGVDQERVLHFSTPLIRSDDRRPSGMTPQRKKPTQPFRMRMPACPLLPPRECHDPICFPGLASVFGERLLPSSDVDLRSCPQKATQHCLAPYDLFSVELAYTTEESTRHLGKEGSCGPGICPVDRPLRSRRIKETYGDALEGCTITDRQVAIEVTETVEKRCHVGARLEINPLS